MSIDCKNEDGSSASFYTASVLPDALLTAKASIYTDLATGSKEWMIVIGTPYQTGSDGKKFSHQYFDLTIHYFAPTQENCGEYVLDFTLHDKADGEGTSGLESVLQLEHVAYGSGSQNEDGNTPQTVAANEFGKQITAIGRCGLANFSTGSDNGITTVNIQEITRLIFGALQEQDTWSVFDGQSRRGILIFNLNSIKFLLSGRLQALYCQSFVFHPTAHPIRILRC